MHAGLIYSDTHVCKVLLHQARNVINPPDMSTGYFMFLFCLVFAMSLCASVYMCYVVACWERADLLALVYGV